MMVKAKFLMFIFNSSRIAALRLHKNQAPKEPTVSIATSKWNRWAALSRKHDETGSKTGLEPS